ncbi:MAG: ATP-grasp domain-containing protein [Candidatus Bathyarchaeota archaeon]|nr:ATP-grasp domain-containing protein [Candidatus Bathyarchaeum sp.]
MNLLIVEYASGGGYTNQKLSSSILSEGYAMLRSLIADCKASDHKVTTLLDSRLKEFNPPNQADKIFSVTSLAEFSAKLTEQAKVADAVYVIAPDSGQMLENLVQDVEDSGGTSINCSVDSIKRVSNKMKTSEALKKMGLKVPETVLLDIHETVDNIKQLTKELGYPLVFKPLDGVSCDGLSIVKDEEAIASAVKKVAHESTGKQFIAQKMIMGKTTSVSVISTGDKAVAATLNGQFVTLGSPDEESEYLGGVVPFSHSMEKEALRAAEKAVETLEGLKGYVGVDMILTDEEPVVIEINPRLTTSYVGLRRVTNFNPAETIIDATIKQKLPKNLQHRGYSFFSKVKVPLRRQIFTETYSLKNVVSPPFPIEDKKAYAIIEVTSISPEDAEAAFYRTKEGLMKLYSRGD